MTTSGAVTFTGYTQGLDGNINHNTAGTPGSVGTFITTAWTRSARMRHVAGRDFI